jgi:hypothetical protein
VLPTTLAAYRARHAQIVQRLNTGRFADAVALEVRTPAGSSSTDRLSRNLSDQIAAAQARFLSDAEAAGAAVRGLTVGVPLLSALTALLTLVGLRQRINEYR